MVALTDLVTLSGAVIVTNGVQAVAGTLSVTTGGNSIANFAAFDNFFSDYGAENTSSGRVAAIGSTRSDFSMSTVTGYQIGESSDTSWQLNRSEQAVTNVSGSGKSHTGGANNSSDDTWNYQTNSLVEIESESSGASTTALVEDVSQTTFSATATTDVATTQSGSSGSTVTYSRANDGGSSDAGSGQFETSFSSNSTSAVVTASQGTDDAAYLTTIGASAYSNSSNSLSQVNGVTVSQTDNGSDETNYGSLSSTAVSSSGNTDFRGNETPLISSPRRVRIRWPPRPRC